MTTTPTMHWRTTWSNGDPTYWITFTDVSGNQQRALERAADDLRFQRNGGRWEPLGDRGIFPLFDAVRAEGVKIDFGVEDRDTPFDLQRLRLDQGTRWRLESLGAFVLFELAGYCPVQSSGMVDQTYWYFRARGSYWRFEAGGNEIGTKGPTWWYEEAWLGKTGFEAGYMSDQDAIANILKSVEKFRSDDRAPYEKGHPDYERKTLEGWSVGALTLRRAATRLGISGEDAVQRAKKYGIELPYLADRELKSLGEPKSHIRGYDRQTRQWVEIVDEDE